jgi:hypothetical protein
MKAYTPGFDLQVFRTFHSPITFVETGQYIKRGRLCIIGSYMKHVNSALFLILSLYHSAILSFLKQNEFYVFFFFQITRRIIEAQN